MEHEATQAEERELAGDLWHESDFMFMRLNGKPIDPRSNHNEWKATLAEADVRDTRLHDARRTAAILLLLLGLVQLEDRQAVLARHDHHPEQHRVARIAGHTT